MATLRTYGGVTGDERRADRRAQVLGAGLELLAADDGAQAFTVRGVCREAGLASRYFYESFADAGDLAAAVFDAAVTDLTTATLTALAEAGDEDVAEQARVGVDAIVGHILEDPRRGRLLFSPALAALPAIAERRSASTRLFVGLLGAEAQARTPVEGGPSFDVATEVLVGGLAQAISAWLDGDVDMDRAELVDSCAVLFVAVGDALSRG
jgi:AcrR family transcriptional regulator